MDLLQDSSTVMTNNPFFGNNKKSPEDDIVIDQKNFYKYYKNIYLILPLNTTESYWFDEHITPEQENEIYKNVMVMEKKTTLGKINIFFDWMRTISKEKLSNCHLGSINLEEIESEDILILPLFLLPFNQVITLFELYNEKDWFEQFLVNQKLAEYLKIPTSFHEFKYALEVSPTTYWCKKNNSNINVTNLFLNRNFRWNIFKSNTSSSKLKTIEEMKNYNIKDDNYVSMFFKTKGNFDDKFGKVNFNLHRLPKIKNLVNQEQLNQIMNEISNKNRFQLFFNLLASPEYCHLIMNNGEIWEMMENVIDRCMPLVRYVMFYSYLSLYLRENIKKSFLTKDDPCILTLDNASKLPNFGYIQSDPNSHPAIAAAHLINGKVIPKDNFYGIPYYDDSKMLTEIEQNSLNNLETFKKRFNIFLTGNSSKDILNQVSWENLHVTGSVIGACVPANHPLVNLFTQNIPDYIENKDDYIYHRYFSEYYAESDIDILVNISHPIKFYDRVLKFKKELEESLLFTEGTSILVNMDTIRRGYFKFNHSFVEKKLIPYWKKKEIDLTYEDIINNISNEEYFKYFMPFYQEARDEFYQEFIDKTEMDSKIIKEKYPFFFTDIKPEDLILNLYQKVEGKYYKVEKEDMSETSETNESIDDEPFYGVVESTKYKIHHPIINHTFELFAIPHEDPWSCINKFHMGPVRGYYNGDNVYLTISAVMSYQTNLSPDYRIMFGSKDPAEICNKYRMRGYGVILNQNELAQMITYSENVGFWKNLYQLNKKSKSSLDIFLNFKDINDNLFKPRKYNSDHYKDCNFVDLEYSKVYPHKTKMIQTTEQLIKLHEKQWHINNQIITEIYLKHQFLQNTGRPKPLQRWMIDSAWDLFEMDKVYC